MDRGSVLGLDPLRGHQARARRAIRMPRRARRPPGDRVRTPHRAGRRTSCRRGTAPRADGARSGTGAGGYGRRPHCARLCCRAARVGRPLPPVARRRPRAGPAHQRRGREPRLPRSDRGGCPAIATGDAVQGILVSGRAANARMPDAKIRPPATTNIRLTELSVMPAKEARKLRRTVLVSQPEMTTESMDAS